MIKKFIFKFLGVIIGIILILWIFAGALTVMKNEKKSKVKTEAQKAAERKATIDSLQIELLKKQLNQ